MSMAVVSTHSEDPEEFPIEIVEEICKCRSMEILCDVELLVEGKKHFAHKVILAALSPVLKERFTGSCSESDNSCVELLTVQTCAIEVLLNYGYGQEVTITEDNVLAVARAAYFLQVSDVEKKSFEFLVKNMNAGNCYGIYKLAKGYLNDHFKKTAKDFLLRHFRQVSHEEEFLEMDADELLEMISDENLFVDNEDEVFVAVLRWFLAREEQRMPFLDEILSRVLLAYVSPNLLKEYQETVSLLQKSNIFVKFVNESQTNRAMLQQASKRRPSWPVEVLVYFVTSSASPRPEEMREVCVSETGVVIKERVIKKSERRLINSSFISDGETNAAVVGDRCSLETYDKDSGSWTKLDLPPLKSQSSGYACIGDDWYVLGGDDYHGDFYDDFDSSNELLRWNSLTKEEEHLKPMKTAVSKPRVVTLGGKIYVCGGVVYEESYDYNDQCCRGCRGRCRSPHEREASIRTHDVLQRYDIATNTWDEFSLPPPDNRQVVGACVLNGFIFCFRRHYPINAKGVQEAKEMSKAAGSQQQAFMFNAKTEEWETCGDLNHIFVSGPVLFKGMIYVVSKTVTWRNDIRAEHFLERYSAETNTWEIFAEFPGFTPEAVLGPLPVRFFRDDDQRNDVKLRLLSKNF